MPPAPNVEPPLIVNKDFQIAYNFRRAYGNIVSLGLSIYRPSSVETDERGQNETGPVWIPVSNPATTRRGVTRAARGHYGKIYQILSHL